MNKYVDYIRSQLDERTLLEQLAEESAEFTQAVLKLIRSNGLSKNRTPVTLDEAEANFIEEWQDINLVFYILGLIDDKRILDNPKLKRWSERLGYKEE